MDYSKCTKEPWFIVEGDGTTLFIASDSGEKLAEILPVHVGNRKSNAALFRKAPLLPEMAEALRAAQQVLNAYIEGEKPHYHPGLADQKIADVLAKFEADASS